AAGCRLGNLEQFARFRRQADLVHVTPLPAVGPVLLHYGRSCAEESTRGRIARTDHVPGLRCARCWDEQGTPLVSLSRGVVHTRQFGPSRALSSPYRAGVRFTRSPLSNLMRVAFPWAVSFRCTSDGPGWVVR